MRLLTQGDTDLARRNAERVVELERNLGVFTERAVQRLAMHSETVVAILNRYYVGAHFLATIIVLLWASWRHPDAYRRIRVAFLAATVASLAIHVAVPLAPPRMLAGHGFVDTLRLYGPRIYPTDTTQSVANQFAAMPSVHFAWAVLVAGALIATLHTRWRYFALAHPVITLFAIVATANHYWLDAFVALVLVVVAWMATRWWSRRSEAVPNTAGTARWTATSSGSGKPGVAATPATSILLSSEAPGSSGIGSPIRRVVRHQPSHAR